MATDQDRLDELKKTLEKIQELSGNVTVDPASFQTTADAVSGILEAQKQVLADTKMTTEEYERAEELLSVARGTLEQQTDINQKQIVQLRQQNNQRSKANQLNSRILQTLTRMTAEIKKQNAEFDAQEVALAKATGTVGSYQQAFLDVSIQARQIGATAADVSKNMQTLFTSFSGFTKLTMSQRATLSSFATTLDKVGFSAGNFATMLDVGTKAAGMSVMQVKNAAAELVSFGQSAGISIEQLSKDVAGVGKQIYSVFGRDNGQRVFKEMALAAKNLGMSMDSLYNITERFTTFQGAATAAGQLNSALGGNFINTIDLMNASLRNPTDAFRLLKKGMDESGRSFQDMTPEMKKFIAEASGIGDVSEAARIMSQDIDKASASLEKAAKTQEELNKIAQYFVPIMDKIKMLAISLSPVFETVTKIFGKFIDLLLWIINSPVVEPFKELIGVAIIAIPLFMKFSGIISSIGGVFASLGGALAAPIAAFGSLGAAIASFGATIATGAVGLLAFGAAVALIGGGIWLASEGISRIVESFKGLSENADSAVASLAIFGATMVGMALAISLAVVALAKAALATPLIYGLAAAVIAVGAAFYLMSLGVSTVSENLSLAANSLENIVANASTAKTELSSFFDSITDAQIKKIQDLTDALNGLATSFTDVEISAPLAFSSDKVGNELTSQNAEMIAASSTSRVREEKNNSNRVIELKIDAPIQIESTTLGRWVQTIVQKENQKGNPGASLQTSMIPSA